ncbi:cache domain-containing protein [Vibrio renipiscarius]|uniref:Histidine kinase n=1 Tax=Vibrio renipiscarius TaxID=1461322 RepID=A0A0C2KBK7_9VIBR|nr:cache domain-containing protein [Vibrio renipiscarius]KII79413.1 hypothetical protein PL18_07015 [Vibrio renipiscarius]KII80958.1 hypothetical protein OJ16_06650 [Vibrio renipiscarius]
MNAFTDRKLLYTIKVIPLALIIIFISLLFVAIVSDSQARLKQLEENLVTNNLTRQKEMIAQRVESAYNQVRYQRRQTVSLLKSRVKHQVDIAHQVSMAIYRENADKPPHEIQRIIADALRNIRYNNGQGYFFIYQADGTNVMHATHPQQEGKQVVNMTDSRGVFFIKELINRVQRATYSDGAYYRWWFDKPQAEGEHEKIGYGRKFEPFNWIIGSGEYVEDAEQQVKNDILNWISNSRFGRNGYLFVLTEQGEILAHKDIKKIGTHLESLTKHTREQFISANTSNSFIHYQSPYLPDGLTKSDKVSYIQYDYEWGWVIGSGVYLEDIHDYIKDPLIQMREQHQQEQIRIIVIFLSLALVLISLSLLLSRYLGKRFNQFQQRIEIDFGKLAQSKEQLRYQAQHDSLTGLPNRVLLEKNTKFGIASSHLQNKMLAMLFVDLDNFKRVNDKYSHEIGDALLVKVGQRFEHLIAGQGTVARFGGDEFVFSIPLVESKEHAHSIAQKIQACLDEPFVIEGISLDLSSSIGVSTYPTDGDTTRELMSKADIVLTRSKKQGKGLIAFFDQQIRAELHHHFLLEDEFKSALSNDELEIYYQPQVDSSSGKIVGIEALCRWVSPTLGFVSPLVFIDIAEKNNAIIELGAFVLDRAFRDAKQLNQYASEPISISVNVSPKQLLHPNFVDLVISTSERYQLSSDLVILELTENVFIEDLKAVQPTLIALQKQGFGISLDDFGTGFSSLSYLNALPINEIKIDRSFIVNMLNEHSSLTIVKTIIAIAQSNDLQIVAEGVEELAQQQLLQELGCMTIQGYLYSKPVKFELLTNMVSAPLCCE